MKKNYVKGVLLLSGMLLFQSLTAEKGSAQSTTVYYTENGFAEFTSRAPMLTFTGTSEKLTGLIDLEQNLLDFYLDLETLDTGIRLRNKHMRDSYLETEQFPYAEFRGRLKELPDFSVSDTVSVIAVGQFNVHGVEQPLEVPGKLIRTKNGLELVASWTLKLPDFNIDVPKVVFYELSETQEVRISGLFQPYTPSE